MKIFSGLLVSLVLSFLLIATSISAQNVSLKHGSDSIKCVTNLSLYSELYKQKNYSDAIIAWRYVIDNCPQASENSFIDGVNMFRTFIIAENDVAKRAKLIDTLMWIYDLRIKYFGKEGKNLSEKAADLFSFDVSKAFDAFNLFKRSVNLTGNTTNDVTLITYCNAAAKSLKTGKIEQPDFFKVYEQSDAIVEENLKISTNKEDSLKWNSTRHNIDEYAESLLDCQNLMKIYKKKYDTTSNDVELLNKISKLFVLKNCSEDSLVVTASEKLYKIQPSATLAFSIANARLKIKSYDKALEYFNLVITTSDNSNEKAQSYYFMGVIEEQKKAFAEARNYALKALQEKASFGEAYILIANCYALSAATCGDDEVASHAAFWCAVDILNKAKLIDPSVESNANNLISQYSRSFPNKETLFFHDIKEGATYTVGCWINEKTTVRASR